jgi:hypothetical protein
VTCYFKNYYYHYYCHYSFIKLYCDQRRPVRRADNLTTFMYRLASNLGASTSWKLRGSSRPVEGLLYPFYIPSWCGKQELYLFYIYRADQCVELLLLLLILKSCFWEFSSAIHLHSTVQMVDREYSVLNCEMFHVDGINLSIRWPCGLRPKSAAAWLLESRVRIPLKVWMFVSYVCCLLLCVAASATRWSLSQRACVELCVI